MNQFAFGMSDMHIHNGINTPAVALPHAAKSWLSSDVPNLRNQIKLFSLNNHNHIFI